MSELSERNVANPAELVRLGQVIKAKLIALDPSQRKIGLSVKALTAPAKPAAEKKTRSLDEVSDAEATDTEAKPAKKAPKKAAAEEETTEATADEA